MGGFRVLCAVIGVVAFTAAAVSAVPSAYLKLEGVTDQSRDTAHPGWIEVSSYEWHLSKPRDSASGKHVALVIHKLFDLASPRLLQAATAGKHFPTAQFEAVGPDGRQMHFTLQDVVIISVKSLTDVERPHPEETITLECAKASVQYEAAAK